MKNEKSTVVFLHGWGLSPKDYQPLINLLSKKHQVIALNLFDLIDKKDFSWSKFVGNLDKLVGKKEIYLLGVSLGGGLALAYAAFYPEKVKAVIACEPVGIKIKRSKAIWFFLIAKMMARGLFYPNGIIIVPKIFLNFLGKCIFNFSGIYQLTKLGLEIDLENAAGKIRAPVFLFWSRNPDLLPLWLGERLHRRIDNCKFCSSFSDKNHLWCLFEQKKIAKEIFKIF